MISLGSDKNWLWPSFKSPGAPHHLPAVPFGQVSSWVQVFRVCFLHLWIQILTLCWCFVSHDYSPGWPTLTWSQRTSCSPLPIGRFRTTLESARTFEKSKAQRWEKLRYYNVSSKSLRCAWLTLGRPPLTGNTTARWCLQDTTGSFVILSHQFRFQSFLWPTNFTLQTWWSPGHPKSSWSWVGHNHVTFGA